MTILPKEVTKEMACFKMFASETYAYNSKTKYGRTFSWSPLN